MVGCIKKHVIVFIKIVAIPLETTFVFMFLISNIISQCKYLYISIIEWINIQSLFIVSGMYYSVRKKSFFVSISGTLHLLARRMQSWQFIIPLRSSGIYKSPVAVAELHFFRVWRSIWKLDSLLFSLNVYPADSAGPALEIFPLVYRCIKNYRNIQTLMKNIQRVFYFIYIQDVPVFSPISMAKDGACKNNRWFPKI